MRCLRLGVQTEYTALPGFVKMMIIGAPFHACPACHDCGGSRLAAAICVGAVARSANQDGVRRESGSAAAAVPTLSIPGAGSMAP